MKRVLLIGVNEELQRNVSTIIGKLGNHKIETTQLQDELGDDGYDLLLMNPMSDAISPVEIIKLLAGNPKHPALGLLGEKGRSERLYEVYRQYARAKGIQVVAKLFSPHFPGDFQLLLERVGADFRKLKSKKHYVLSIDMLSRAIDRHELQVYFQPKIGLRRGYITGAEALVRWQHPEFGLLFPDSFIPVFEETGLISNLTWYVLNESLDQMHHWRKLGYDFKVAVNFSATTFSDKEMAQRVLFTLQEKGLDPDCLSIELTESAMVKEIDLLLETVLLLHKAGVEISIDDFGTGYSSLQQVSMIPAGELKIDQSFVQNMNDNPVDYLIVRNTVRMAHSLDMRVLGEGVETKRHAMALQRIGCDEAQGYFYSKPVNRYAFLAYADKNPSRSMVRHINLHQS